MIDNAHLADDAVGIAELSATGTASSSTFLRGDNAWAALTTEITKSTSYPHLTTNPSGGVGTLWVRTTTGEMYCCTDATSNANVWTNVSGNGDIRPSMVVAATGGTITTDGNYKVHTFTGSGTFTVTSTGGGDAGGGLVEYLVIAGGAGGSGGSAGGGAGGAGGYLAGTNFSVSSQAYTVTIGAGGAGNTSPDNNHGTQGAHSLFGSIISTGGGYGAGGGVAPSYTGIGGDGGSGGGGRYAGAGGSGTLEQGNAGGNSTASGARGGGGGGGASAAGVAGDSGEGGNGGAGQSSSITGSAVTRGGGGGGGCWNTGPGGSGGAGGGGNGHGQGGGTQTAGTANTGGGGGGNGASANGAAGGSGVVIIRYLFQ